jgi:cytoskeleton protein RodZ
MNFGGHLREARERRGVSLKQIAVTTRISLRTLEALENNEVGKLPGGIFSRAFVRTYATEVGLDPDETVREFVQNFPLDHVTAGTAAANEGDRVLGEDEQRRRRTLGIILTVAIGLPIAVLIIYLLVSARRPVSASAAPPDNAVVTSPPTTSAATSAAPNASTTTAASRTSSPGSVPSTGSSAAVGLSPSAAVTPARTDARLTSTSAIAPGEPLRLRIAPTGACWVRVKEDGTVKHQALMQKGDVFTLDAKDDVQLIVGDAGTFRFSVNNREGRALGDSGEVVDARITRANLQSWLRSQ